MSSPIGVDASHSRYLSHSSNNRKPRSIPIATWKCVKLQLLTSFVHCASAQPTKRQHHDIPNLPVVSLLRIREIAFRHTKQTIASNRVLLLLLLLHSQTQNCTFFRSAPVAKRRIFSD